MEESAIKSLSETQQTIKEKGFTTGGLLCYGNISEGILEAAKQFEVDMIVMGHRDLGTVQSLISPSVATSVVHDSDRPVMIVR
mmetsp:Transcript_89561/g.124402  ORF Transcript_89561/g.124402 Transcript_89561/m.124402 type:complete len:83 (+) Transcript_89561:258-506(+)